MKLRIVFQTALRESRGARGRLMFFTACLAIGVAAITGVAALSKAIQDGLRAQSRELLSADLVVEGRRALPIELDGALANQPNVERADVRELVTMASGVESGKSRLIEAKAVRGRFPFYGTIQVATRDSKGGNEFFASTLADDKAIVAPELFEALGVSFGDSIRIGGAQYEVAGIVEEEPGRFDFALTAGPRVFLTLGGLERADLDDFGARIRHKALFRLPADPPREALNELKTSLKRDLPGSVYLTIETHSDAQPMVRRAIQRVEHFVALGALLSLVLGGVGVSMIVRAWLSSRTAGIAVMRCIGYRPREILVLYAANVVLLALVGSIVGGILGSLVPLFLPSLMSGLLPAGFELHWEPISILRGVAFGIVIALVFSIPPLTGIWRVPPSRVLRNEAEPLPPNRAVQVCAGLVLALGLFATAWVQSQSPLYAAYFAGGVAALAGLLALAASLLRRVASWLPRRRMNPHLLHGIAALARPNAGVTGAVVALGLGVLVITAMALVETRLTEKLRTALPFDAPTAFLLDVQPKQWDGVRTILQSSGASAITEVPVVTARLDSVDGVDVATLAEKSRLEEDPDRRSWMFTREQRMTWMQDLPRDNRIVEGALWTDASPREVSVEVEYAKDLGASVGSKIVFDVQGAKIEFVVTSLRSVEWESFGVNFFLIAEPGALDDAPRFMLAAAKLDAASEAATQDALAKDFPNVTMIRVRTILEKLVKVMLRLAIGVRILGSFTILTGIVILAGVVSASTLHRAREVALLKTLGVTRGGVAALFAVEFALIGLVAGLIGACAAFVLAWTVLDRLIELDAALPWWSIPVAALGTAALAAVCGLLACTRALATRPIESLRG
ncbi:MAG: FtsX-like permease family protein [Planctomycetota bacterium]|nr:FtsX-like permease family protein [Planctomycetota bacterium]